MQQVRLAITNSEHLTNVKMQQYTESFISLAPTKNNQQQFSIPS